MVARQVRGPAVRERLLDAAETLFHRDGIGRTGVDAVLAQAGVSTATLYAHFGGKDPLVAAYLQRRLDRWRRVWDDAVAAATTPEDRLLAVFDALARFRADQPAARGCAFLATAVEIPGPDHPALDVVAADTAHLRDRLRSLAADLPVADPDSLAEHILLAYDGTLAAFLRGTSDDAVTRGRALAVTAVTHAEGNRG
ncbi:TetR/AcrR family transcriptional regulator [Blastococcus saxobsidens]|uniref:Transcriptional regulator, TetR family n=1 Tax=Blastococcus saxobsidens (strain DD2) TaxID=1146883 RepID=H6RJ39_BLASD|nr:TetR/AcrR family transcriptional regulator [Blastococcus saxobsidens]CCG04784.1 Transcriptional regulator, TetR family [Blastococcus saxobsidens DD2]